MNQPDLVKFFLISLLIMCIVLFINPDLYSHIQKIDPRMFSSWA
jgi:hypothetical protein